MRPGRASTTIFQEALPEEPLPVDVKIQQEEILVEEINEAWESLRKELESSRINSESSRLNSNEEIEGLGEPRIKSPIDEARESLSQNLQRINL